VRIAVQENLVPGDGVLARAEAARALGFAGLELRDTGTARVAELRAAVDAGAWLPSSCPETDGFIADFDLDRRERAITRLLDQIDGLAAIGGRTLVTPAAWGMFSRRLPPFEPPRSEESDRELVVDALRRLGARAAERGVRVLLEPLNRYEDHMVNTLAQGAALCEASGSPGVGILADTYHMNIEEDDLCAALEAAAPWVGEVHLSDSGRGQPGTGHVPFDRVLATLERIGFDGVLAIECRLRGEPSDALRAAAAFLGATAVAPPDVSARAR
jgi:sugar phosphate isomerase/epimerase